MEDTEWEVAHQATEASAAIALSKFLWQLNFEASRIIASIARLRISKRQYDVFNVC